MNIKEIKTHFISNLAALARKSKTCERLIDLNWSQLTVVRANT